MKTQQILEHVYPELSERAGSLKRRPRRWLATKRWLARKSRAMAVVLLLITGWVVAHLYYYNKLVGLEYNVQACWAQVETQLQRRYHIQLNLTRMVLDYAEHERTLLTGITKLRTSALQPSSCSEAGPPSGGNAARPPTDPAVREPAETASPSAPEAAASTAARPLEELSPKEIQELFSRIMVVAEQYPQLKLSENFQQFSTAVIETETEIAKTTSAYNDAVNLYGTTLTQFPGNIFAWLGGFEEYEFYQPEQAALQFRRVEY